MLQRETSYSLLTPLVFFFFFCRQRNTVKHVYANTAHTGLLPPIGVRPLNHHTLNNIRVPRVSNRRILVFRSKTPIRLGARVRPSIL